MIRILFLLWLGSSWRRAIGFLVMISFFIWMLFTEVWSVCENVCTSLYVCLCNTLPPPTHTQSKILSIFLITQQKDFQTLAIHSVPSVIQWPGHLLPTLWHMYLYRSTHSAGTSLGPCFSSSSLSLFLCWKCHLLYEASFIFRPTDLSWACVHMAYCFSQPLRALGSLLTCVSLIGGSSAVAGTVSRSPFKSLEPALWLLQVLS